VTVTEAGRAGRLTGLLDRIDGTFLAEPRPELAPLVHWGGGAHLPIHRWFRYREGFSPGLIPALGLGRRILDPFCGSGSIMVGAAQQGRSSTGIDVNPLAAFVARTKLSPRGDREVRAVARFAEGLPERLATTEPWPVPGLRIAGKVFEPEVLETLLRLRTLVEGRTGPVRDLLLLAWLAILQPVGSYFKEGNGIKYRNRKRLRTGYAARPDGEWQRARFGPDQAAFVTTAYAAKLDEIVADAPAWQAGTWGDQRVLLGSAVTEAVRLAPGSFDSVVFSPPYANRFDYFESMKVELWFGGFVDSYEALGALRKRSLRSHLGAALDHRESALPEVEELVGLLDPGSYAVRMRVPALVRGYFEDMGAVLRACRAALAPGGECHVVVGNSAYARVIIPADALIARLGLAAGFERASVVPVRHLTVAPQQRTTLRGRERHMRESVVTLR
jgi:site-specific DNA-methyltransferase (adenine-specific)